MDIETWLRLLVFTALVCMSALYGLAASGHFPREHRAESLQSPSGTGILFGSMAVTALSALVGVGIATRIFPWYAAVIGAGLVLLATPLLLRPLSDSFVNGRMALITFSAASVALAGLLAVL
jgi:hypothetical protein